MTDPTGMPEACAEIRLLMIAEAERELSDFEVKRVEGHVNDCADCRDAVAGNGELEMVLQSRPIELPDPAQWEAAGRMIQERIQERIPQESHEESEGGTPKGDPVVTSAGPRPERVRPDEPRIERSSPAPWKTWLPLAAAILLSVLVLNNIFESGLSESREQEFTAEIIDPPAGTESIILVPEDEDGVIMITFTNS